MYRRHTADVYQNRRNGSLEVVCTTDKCRFILRNVRSLSGKPGDDYDLALAEAKKHNLLAH